MCARDTGLHKLVFSPLHTRTARNEKTFASFPFRHIFTLLKLITLLLLRVYIAQSHLRSIGSLNRSLKSEQTHRARHYRINRNIRGNVEERGEEKQYRAEVRHAEA